LRTRGAHNSTMALAFPRGNAYSRDERQAGATLHPLDTRRLLMDPTLLILLVLVIGIVVGVGALRVNRPSWLTRQIAGGRRAELTSALVGIAGAFIGFHLGALFIVSTIVLLIAAIIGAVVVVWAWREVKL